MACRWCKSLESQRSVSLLQNGFWRGRNFSSGYAKSRDRIFWELSPSDTYFKLFLLDRCWSSS